MVPPSPMDMAPPLHGYRGDTEGTIARPKPRGLTVAISRQVGARGGNVAKRAGALLGWQVFDQDSLDYLMRDEAARTELFADLPDGAREWAEMRAMQLSQGRNWPVPFADMIRLILTLAARGEVIIVGRGAGFLLPASTTVHVRIVAPLAERIAFFADLSRLPPNEARSEVLERDHLRDAFVRSVVTVDPTDVGGYDMVLNTGRLGEFASAGLIVQAVVGRVATAEEAPSSAEIEIA